MKFPHKATGYWQGDNETFCSCNERFFGADRDDAQYRLNKHIRESEEGQHVAQD